MTAEKSFWNRAEGGATDEKARETPEMEIFMHKRAFNTRRPKKALIPCADKLLITKHATTAEEGGSTKLTTSWIKKFHLIMGPGNSTICLAL